MLKDFELAAERFRQIKTAALDKKAGFLLNMGIKAIKGIGGMIARNPVKSLEAGMAGQQTYQTAKNTDRAITGARSSAEALANAQQSVGPL